MKLTIDGLTSCGGLSSAAMARESGSESASLTPKTRLSGFLFSSLTGAGLTAAVKRAFGAFRSKGAFTRMREHAVAKRFDWSGPTDRYAALYEQALAG